MPGAPIIVACTNYGRSILSYSFRSSSNASPLLPWPLKKWILTFSVESELARGMLGEKLGAQWTRRALRGGEVGIRFPLYFIKRFKVLCPLFPKISCFDVQSLKLLSFIGEPLLLLHSTPMPEVLILSYLLFREGLLYL